MAGKAHVRLVAFSDVPFIVDKRQSEIQVHICNGVA